MLRNIGWDPLGLILALVASAMANAIGPLSESSSGSIKCLFSDIDGTLVHYYENDANAPGQPEVLPLPASATGRMGRISLETLRLAARMRGVGARLVLVSGTRYSTFATRLPYLPRADAYVIENGGRIFYPPNKEQKKKNEVAETPEELENAEKYLEKKMKFLPPGVGEKQEDEKNEGGIGSGNGGGEARGKLQEKLGEKLEPEISVGIDPGTGKERGEQATGEEEHNKESVGDGGRGGEGGGEEEGVDDESAIGDPSLTGHAARTLTEDLKWRERLESVVGPASQDSKPPGEREGPLWDVYRRAVSEGFEVDTNTYYTMLRVKVHRDQSEAIKGLLNSLPPGLRVVTNFGMVDICPDASGKHNAAAYLAAERFGIPLGRCASMGDDDNDIALANIMGKGAFITTFSSESVEAASKENPEHFRVATEEGVKSSEQMLKLILNAC